MAFLSSLFAVAEPKGFWINIIRAFEGVTKNYVLAIIFLTVVIRLIWGLIDTLTKFNSQHMSSINAKMQPELEKLKAKYANQPAVLQQKQNELYKRYYGKSQIGSCLITLAVMGLNLLIFFTLFAGLNTMSAYKISSNYENIKYNYANCLNVTNNYWQSDEISLEDKKELFLDYKNLSFVINENEEGKTISLVHKSKVDNQEQIIYTSPYKDDFSEKVNNPEIEDGEASEQVIRSNENIIKLINQYFPTYEEGEEVGSKDIVLGYEKVTNDEGVEEDNPIYLSNALYDVALRNVVETYDLTQEKFLWIQNIWIADSPLNKSIVSFSTLKNQVGKNQFEKDEETIYNAFMPGLKAERNRTNGYFILTILIVAVTLLSMQLTKFYNNRKNGKRNIPSTPQAGGKWMQIFLPVMLGIFALFYNSVFAIYMLTGQVVSSILLIPQLMFVDWVIGKKNKRKKDKVIEVDYSRKF